MWIIWTFIPMLTWAGWIHAGIRSKHSKYFVIAALYGIPFMLAMIFSEDKKSSNGEYSQTYNAIMSLNMLIWIGGIIHAQVIKKEVNLRIKYAGHATSSGLSSTDGELDRRIAAEYGVQLQPSNAPSVGRSIQAQNDVNVTSGDMSFVEWYTLKFNWFVTQPMPWSIVFQVPLWLFYGFIWIPLFYAISDKRRIGGQLSPTIREREHQPMQTAPILQQPASRAKPRPPVAPKLSEGQTNSSGVDVNNAGEQDIAALPGIGPILAKKAIKIRQSQGGFESIEQFAQGLGLKPHIVEQIRLRVVIGPYSVQSPGVVKKASGRVVDF